MQEIPFIPQGGFYPSLSRLCLMPDEPAGGGQAPEEPVIDEDEDDDEPAAPAPTKKEQRKAERAAHAQALQTALTGVREIKETLLPAFMTEIKTMLAGGAKKEEEKEPTLRQTVTDLSKKLNETTENLARERRVNKLQAEISKFSWFDPQDAIDKILPNVQEKDGKIFVPGIESVEGVEVPKHYTLSEAVANLAKAKPYMIKANVSGGSGASGVNGGGNSGNNSSSTSLKSQITKWKQVKDDPILRAKLIMEDPEYAVKLQTEWETRQRDKMRQIRRTT